MACKIKVVLFRSLTLTPCKGKRRSASCKLLTRLPCTLYTNQLASKSLL